MKQFSKVEDLILENIIVQNAAIENQQGENIEPGKISIFAFNIGLTKGLNLEQERILIKILVEIGALDDNRQPLAITGQFTIDFIYRVTTLAEFINKEEDKLIIEKTLGGMLLSTAYSTARGIIYTRCQGTLLGNIILPILSLQRLLETSNTENIKENIQLP